MLPSCRFLIATSRGRSDQRDRAATKLKRRSGALSWRAAAVAAPSPVCSLPKLPALCPAKSSACLAKAASPYGRLPTQVRQAAAAIAAQLTTAAGSGKGKAKGFTEGGDRKLSVDVPVLESGAAATLQLAQEILAALPKQLRQQFTIVTCEEGGGSPGPAGGSSSGGVATLSLQQCVAEGRDLDGCLLIAGPSPTQASPANHINCLPCARNPPPTAQRLAALPRRQAWAGTLQHAPSPTLYRAL